MIYSLISVLRSWRGFADIPRITARCLKLVYRRWLPTGGWTQYWRGGCSAQGLNDGSICCMRQRLLGITQWDEQVFQLDWNTRSVSVLMQISMHIGVRTCRDSGACINPGTQRSNETQQRIHNCKWLPEQHTINDISRRLCSLDTTSHSCYYSSEEHSCILFLSSTLTQRTSNSTCHVIVNVTKFERSRSPVHQWPALPVRAWTENVNVHRFDTTE